MSNGIARHQDQPAEQPDARQQMRVQPKNSAAAIALSFLIPGVGSMYAGNSGVGVLILTLYVMSLVLCLVLIGFVLAPVVWIWGMMNAHSSATNWNHDHGIIS